MRGKEFLEVSLYITEYQKADSHQYKLVREIDQKAVPAAEAERTQAPAKIFLRAISAHDMPQIVTEEKHKNPRDNREIVG